MDLPDTTILNRGIGGDTIEDLIGRFEETFLNKGEIHGIFIMIGINNLSKQDFHIENFLEKYSFLLEKLSYFIIPNKICILSILSVHRENISNLTIGKANNYLRSYAHTNNLCYIDLHDRFLDSTGQLDVKYSLDDIHLTSAGYKVWLKPSNLIFSINLCHIKTPSHLLFRCKQIRRTEFSGCDIIARNFQSIYMGPNATVGFFPETL